MKKGILFLLVMFMFLVSCKDDENETSTISSYLKENNITSYKTTDSGLIYTIDESGDGLSPEIGDTLQVEYTGYFTNDEVFDTSVGSDPFEFVLGIGQVIPGWDEGIALFNDGGSGMLFIPAKLAYGTDDMIFEISVKSVVRGIVGYTIEDYINSNDWENYSTTESGIHYRITDVVSDSDKPVDGNTVTVDYTGYYLNNEVFDTSINKTSLTFELGSSSIIKGFSESVYLLREGETGDFLIPSELAYGETGIAGVFAPNQIIMFNITLISFQ
ncbi:MAG: FKBP-type peptidyl-prolyl cis-trans isomerase [Reichenbachiella sp.]|uniref:FKBP-type peptidyl-prolyl cis-trans isomerase n=1 Tax=Reichenbachiella sp. TaxID=2184521 RepID=UPI003296D719